MASRIQAPRLSYEQIRASANDFLARYNPSGVIPVPIEPIVEFALKINIVPIPGLQRALETEGFISSDFKTISVDQFVLEERERRYRFTLAHEIGHFWLHKEVFSGLEIRTVNDWKKYQSDLDTEAYGWLEWQAYSFGGLVLAPKEKLFARRAIAEEKIAKEGLDPKTEAAQFYVCKYLADDFNVSEAVIDKRTQRDR